VCLFVVPRTKHRASGQQNYENDEETIKRIEDLFPECRAMHYNYLCQSQKNRKKDKFVHSWISRPKIALSKDYDLVVTV
jgi:hypothetical protein